MKIHEYQQMMNQLTKPPSPYTKEERKQMVKEFHKKRETELNKEQQKPKPMNVLKYMDTMNQLYSDGPPPKSDAHYDRVVTDAKQMQKIKEAIPVSPMIKEDELFNDKILKRDKYEPKKIIKKEMKMADLDNLPTWFLKNLDDLILEYQEDIGDRPGTLNDLEKWYRNKHGTTTRKSKEKEIRVVKKSLPKDWTPKYINGNVIDITPLIDDDWFKIFEDLEDPPKEESRLLLVPKSKAEGIQTILNLHRNKNT